MAFASVSGTADFLAERATAVSFRCWDGLAYKRRSCDRQQACRARHVPRTWLRSSVQRDDHFVGAHQSELRPRELVGKIGIGVTRVEQLRTVLKLGLFPLELG